MTVAIETKNYFLWFRERAEIFNISAVEKFCGIPPTTLDKALKNEGQTSFKYNDNLRMVYALMHPDPED